MRRFFVEPESLKEKLVTLTGDEFHHLKNVSRLEEGERLELIDGVGNIAKGTIEKLEKRSALIRVDEVKSLPPPPTPHIEIVLSVPRFQKMDLIIQKSVELGLSELTPVVSDRSFVKTISRELIDKIPRWEKIAQEACKQSGRVWPMTINGPISLAEAVSQGGDSLFLYEGESTTDIKSALSQWSSPPKKIRLFIGSEGGFSQQEVAGFISQGLKPITMGPLVLRVETACIAILSVIEYHFGLMR